MRLCGIALAACIASSAQAAHVPAYDPYPTPPEFSCAVVPFACRTGSATTLSDDQIMALAKRVNAEVNRSLRYVRWSVPNWRLPTDGQGDCDQFALLKMQRLIDAGVPPGRLLLAVVENARMVTQGSRHAVLVV